MEYRKLGHTDLRVSAIALGSMTWGEQNTESEAHNQLDYAIERGINFIDTAELYAIPPKAETQGVTESCIGSWLDKRQDRDKLIIASKVCGPGADWLPHIRNGPRLNRRHMTRALDASLQRLRTDYIDLYQIHWPERPTNYFGQLGYSASDNAQAIPIEETLEVLNEFVNSGRVRYIGLSNETPWGVMEYLRLAKAHDWPRIVSIQNPYSLLNRSYEIGLAEISHREQTGLLAYSPLGFGVLSGKYLNQATPAQARLTLFQDYSRYSTTEGQHATAAYVALAKAHHLDPAQMALAWVNSRPFVTSTIIGATTMTQLAENIDSIDLPLTETVIEKIEMIHRTYPNPCP